MEASPPYVLFPFLHHSLCSLALSFCLSHTLPCPHRRPRRPRRAFRARHRPSHPSPSSFTHRRCSSRHPASFPLDLLTSKVTQGHLLFIHTVLHPSSHTPPQHGICSPIWPLPSNHQAPPSLLTLPPSVPSPQRQTLPSCPPRINTTLPLSA